MKTSALFLGIFLVTPSFALGQEAKPDACESVDLKAPTEWIGSPAENVNIRVGPGVDYPLHESAELFAGEEIQILQECQGWLQVRAMPEHMIDWAIEQHGLRRAREMLLFWVRKDLIKWKRRKWLEESGRGAGER